MNAGESISEYVSSAEFKERMRRVSAKSIPFGNSTPSEKVYESLAESAHSKRSALGDKDA